MKSENNIYPTSVLTSMRLLRRINLTLSFTQNVTLSASIPLTGSSLELHGTPSTIQLRRLKLSLATVAEPRSHSEEVLSSARSLHRCPQTKEGVMFDGALPQMLAGLLVRQSEDESVFLFAPSFIVLLDNDESEFLLFKI